jgi:hypothetical protein
MKRSSLKRHSWWFKSVSLFLILTLVPSALAAVGVSAYEIPGTSDTPTLYVTAASNVDSLVYAGGQIFWSHPDGCPGGEFALPCVIESKPAGGGLTRTLHNNTSGPAINSNLAADASYVYWINSNGHVVRLSRGAGPSTPPTQLASVEVGTKLFQITVDDDYVYWAENVDFVDPDDDTGRLFRAPKSGGTRELMLDKTRSILEQVRADQQGGVLFITRDCGGICFEDVIHRITPNGSGGFTIRGDRPTVQSYTFDDTTLYYALDLGVDGLQIETAPLSDINDESPGPDLDDSDDAFVGGMAISGTNLFWHLDRPSLGGPIFRLPLAGSPTALTENLQDLDFLTASSRYLFWERLGNQIYRLETDADALSLDLGIADIEITQGIQNLANDVPLVQDRPTLVRVYPELSGYSGASVAAYLTLHGEDGGGTPLPGSPLPTQVVTVRSSGNLRQNLADTANWTLPASWLDDTLTLRAEVTIYNLFDTNAANDSLTLTRSFEPKTNICIKFVPILTTSRLTYRTRSLLTGAPTPGFNSIVSRFSTLWPARRVLWYSQSIALRKPAFIQRPGPFNMVGGADRDNVIGALYEHNIFDSAPDWCGGDNARTHYVAMVHPGINTTRMTATGSSTLLGYASFGEPLSLLKMEGGTPTTFNMPRGGTTMAQEIGHNYNDLFGLSDRWKHVDCGLPAGDDPHDGYPYITNTIGMTTGTNIPRGYWGYDRLSETPIPPNGARDYMSYCEPKWTSDYNWRGAMDATQDLAGAALAGATAPGGATAPAAEILVVYGVVNQSETQAELVSVYRVAEELLGSGGARSATGVRILSGAGHDGGGARPADDFDPPSGSYALELLSAGGDVLASHALDPQQGTHGGQYNFIANVPFVDGTQAVRLVQDGAELERRTASANAPQVTITQPASGASVAGDWTIAWTASDADGDPLTYVVQYSADDGATWTTLVNSYAGTSLAVSGLADLAGSATARVRVIANDGLNVGTGTSEAFSLANHAPAAYISEPVDGAARRAHEAVVLNGYALDPEEGPLPDGSLGWEITGPVTLNATGAQVSFEDLPPGTYTAQLTAQDGQAATGTAQIQFTVSPKRIYDGDTPVLDGYCDDGAYAAEEEPLLLRYPAAQAAGRFVRDAAAGHLYACFEGLRPANLPGEALELRFDVDNSGGSVMSAADLLFAVGPDGVPRTGQGDGAGGVDDDATPQNLAAAVSEAPDGTWSAELRIDVSALGSWDHLVRLMADVGNGDTVRAGWPAQSDTVEPDSWGLVGLGAQPQTIDFPDPGERHIATSPLELAASASSGLPVSYASDTPEVCEVTGTVATLLQEGTCTITASQPGNDSYFPAKDVTQSFEVTGFERVYLPMVIR